jgi:hypothetical protein
VVTTGPLAPIVLNVVKTNDANGDGTYNDSETSLLPGQTVPFRITVTNNSTVAVVIDTVSDTWNDAVGTLSINPQCLVAFVGQVLQPGDAATCDFTVANYSPPNGTNIINTGEVKGHQEKKPDNKGSGTDTSIVDTATPPLTLTVVKTNDANGNGSFTDDETGTTGGSVNFRVAITNSSTVDVVVDSISDVWPGADAISPNCAASIIGAVLPANGGTVTCDFALANYVPNSTDARVNTVTVLAHQNNNPGNSTSQQDTSTVRGEQVADVVIARQPAAPTPLARTGSNTLGLVALGLLLIGLGLGLLLTSGWRPVAGALAVRLPHSASPEVFTPSRVIIDRGVDSFHAWTRGFWRTAGSQGRDTHRRR